MNGRKHGMYGTRIYTIWNSMKNRCTLPKNTQYHYYGGKGISFDPKWRKFEGFYEDMKEGYADNLSIDRIYNHWGYSKENCRWATTKEQGRNKSTNIYYKGKCLMQWCEELKLNYKTVRSKIKIQGRTIKDSLELN